MVKVQVEEPAETEIQQQEKALVADARAFAENEKQLELEKEKTLPPLTAGELKLELGGYKERLEGDKSIVLTMTHGSRPAVEFGGFWNGKLIGNAMNAISRAYRLQRHKNARAHATVPNQKENGDAKV